MTGPGGVRRSARLVVVACVTLGLVACGGTDDEAIHERVLPGGATVFVHGSGSPDGEAAQIVGTLLVADGCVLLEQGGQRFPVVWPAGTSVAVEDPLELALPGGDRLRVGGVVSGGGGYHEASSLGIDVPGACLNEWGEVARFNASDRPTVESR